MELNGVANIMILVDQITQESESNNHINVAIKIKEQAEMLERYMLAFNDAVNKQEKSPYWHEIRENPSKYPRNKDR